MNWYALYVQAGQEDLVQKMIHKFFDKTVVHAVVPKRKLKQRKQGKTYEVCQTMFPGYVLVHTLMTVQTYYDLKRVPRFYRLLNQFDNCKAKATANQSINSLEDALEVYSFSKIDEEEIALILELAGTDDIIDYSTLYVENKKVIVCDGPLKGKEAIIRKIDKHKKRARISLEFMGSEKWLDVGIEMLDIVE
ncbi:antiterminator LoaP [Paenibacillus sp. P32E]|uniref:antiterminator LoaP n=1 Tax=Paenibacillus sp. P32E TaxID=1349434 RepID=UPI00093F8D29|nr:antiterminator LoaP [Paenibacillus sp. P32E]OKP94471.1 transcription antiterminator [Paenibacillus sp. P32E]